MKTSNTILIGLLAVIFAVPFLLASTIAGKMKKGEYTVEKNNKGQSAFKRSGSFAAYKVVKVTSPNPGLLRCHLTTSDKMNYNYFMDTGNDSITVFTSSDTLYVNYIAATGKPGKKDENDHNEFSIDLHLPVFNNLVVDGATVIIDSLSATTNNLSVILKNNGVIKDGSRRKEGDFGVITNAELHKEKTLQVAAANKAQAEIASTQTEGKTFEAAFFGGSYLNIKDLLIYNLLYRIG